MSSIPPPPPPALPGFEIPAVVVEKTEIVTNAKSRLSEYLDSEVSRIRSKYESARQDLDKREAREIAEFLESTCERVKAVDKPVAVEAKRKPSWTSFF